MGSPRIVAGLGWAFLSAFVFFVGCGQGTPDVTHDQPDATATQVDADTQDASAQDAAAQDANVAPSCMDGLRDGNESDVDCGGACPSRCLNGAMCSTDLDCASSHCDDVGRCAPMPDPRCDDGMQNGTETGVDCGGVCPACDIGQPCAGGTDCSSGVCEGQTCRAPTCADYVKNGDETGEDCGGEMCSTCPNKALCLVHDDCASGLCLRGVCSAARCNNGAQDEDESDVDCGGTACAPCATGLRCVTSDDCALGLCTDGTCQPASCFDGLTNGDEVDVDCGGSCAPCAAGQHCAVAQDCLSARCVGEICLPPNPTDIAPPLSTGAYTPTFDAISFLWSGDRPIQTGLTATVTPERAALIRGRVLNRLGRPVAGVQVSVVGRPDYGRTVTREDGYFDLGINGGVRIVLNYARAHALTQQRRVDVVWGGYHHLPDVVMLELDAKVTPVHLTADAPVQIARGSTIIDGDGERSATLLFKPGTQATMEIDGQIIPLSDLRVRATEYTEGPLGPKAMPGELPPEVAYTYAVELTVDEAREAGADVVTFDRAVPFYVENFLEAPVGSIVPAAWYDKTKSAWVPAEDALVLGVISIDAGLATLDLGSGQPATAEALELLGIDEDERNSIASIYAPGQTLVRANIRHFSPHDLNWTDCGSSAGGQECGCGPAGCNCNQGGCCSDGECTCAIGAGCPPECETGSWGCIDLSEEDECKEPGGSFVRVQSRTIGESLAISGTDLSLSYTSLTKSDTKRVVVFGQKISPYVFGASVTLSIDGVTRRWTFDPVLNTTFEVSAPGVDAYGRPTCGPRSGTIEIAYQTAVSYQVFSEGGGTRFNWGRIPPGVTATQMLRSRDAVISERIVGTVPVELTTVPCRAVGGGWGIDQHHRYDPGTGVLTLGDGRRRTIDPKRATADAEILIRGGTELGPDVAANQAALGFIAGVDSGPDGTIYFSDTQYHCIRKLAGDRVKTVVGQCGVSGYTGDGGLATAALVGNPEGLDIGPDGSIYFADSRYDVVRRVDADGIITTISGTGEQGEPADGVPATSVPMDAPIDVALGTDGSIYVLDDFYGCLRKIDPDGLIWTLAGGGGDCAWANPPARSEPSTSDYADPDGVPAFGTPLFGVEGLSVMPDGSIALASARTNAILRYRNGRLSRIFGDGRRDIRCTNYICIDNCLMSNQCITYAWGVDTTPEGDLVAIGYDRANVYIGDVSSGRSRVIALPDHYNLWDVAVTPDGTIYLAETGRGSVSLLRLPRSADVLSTGGTETGFRIPAEDRREIYVFDRRGLHQKTEDALTGLTLWTFRHNAQDALVAIADRYGSETTFLYDADDQLRAIVAPDGRQTTLATNDRGRLSSLTSPSGAEHLFDYNDFGNLLRMVDPGGGEHRFEYDEQQRLTKDTAPWGAMRNLSSVTHQEDGRITREIVSEDETGAQQSYRTNDLGEETFVAGDGSRTFTVVAAGGSRRTTFPSGLVERVSYSNDPKWGEIGAYASDTQLSDPISQRTVRVMRTRTTEFQTPEDPTSPITRMEDVFELLGQSVTRTQSRTYDVATRTETLVDQTSGILKTKRYDEMGRLIESTLGNTGTEERSSTRITRNARGQPVLVDGPRPGTQDATRIAYDDMGRLQSVEGPTDETLEVLSRDTAGRETSIRQPDGRTVDLAYDVLDRVRRVTVGTRVFALDYDDATNTRILTLPTGAAWTHVFGGPNRSLSEIVAPTGARIQIAQDTARTTTEWHVVDRMGEERGFARRTLNPTTSTWLFEEGPIQYTQTLDSIWNNVLAHTQAGRTAEYRRDGLGRLETYVAASGATTHYAHGDDESVTLTGPEGLTHRVLRDIQGNIRRIEAASGFSVDFTYDEARQLASATDARGVLARYVRDADARITQIDLPGDDEDISIRYGTIGNDKGKQIEIANGISRTSMRYDADGRLAERREEIGANVFAVQYAYDADGRLTRLTYPSGMNVFYDRDEAGENIRVRVQRPSDGSPITMLNEISFLPFGPLEGYALSNGTRYTATYDAAYRMTRQWIDGVFDWRYAYDDLGQLTTRTETFASTEWTYAYDDDGRLTSAASATGAPATSETYTYAYDTGGNRVTKTTPRGTSSYAYDPATGRLSSETPSAGPARSFAYAADGNVLGDGASTYGYSAANQLAVASGLTDAAYRYNARLERVLKTAEGQTTMFVYADPTKLMGEYDETGAPLREIVWLGERPVLTYEAAKSPTEILFVHADNLSTPRLITTTNEGIVVWSWQSDPFGEVLAQEDPDGDGDTLAFNLRFPGQYFDRETGLHENHMRFYSPTLGRYLQSDPHPVFDKNHLYAYANSDPISKLDPHGGGVVGAAVLGTVLGVIAIKAHNYIVYDAPPIVLDPERSPPTEKNQPQYDAAVEVVRQTDESMRANGERLPEGIPDVFNNILYKHNNEDGFNPLGEIVDAIVDGAKYPNIKECYGHAEKVLEQLPNDPRMKGWECGIESRPGHYWTACYPPEGSEACSIHADAFKEEVWSECKGKPTGPPQSPFFRTFTPDHRF